MFIIPNGCYNNIGKAKSTLNKFGNYSIAKMWEYRKPIDAVLNTVLHLVSVGQFEDAKKDAHSDKLFHLAPSSYSMIGRAGS